MLAGQPARLVPVDDADALGAALAEEITRLSALAPAERGVRYATDAYDRDHAVARTLAFYRDVIRDVAGRAAPFEDHDEAYAGWHA
jgi:hypothetical protein